MPLARPLRLAQGRRPGQKKGMSDSDQGFSDSARPVRARRSVLYVPASNGRAMEKAAGLPCDSIIFDLEDAVDPSQKQPARQALLNWFRDRPSTGAEVVIRINAPSSPWGKADLDTVCACRPDAMLLPKVREAADIMHAEDLLAGRDMPGGLRLWAMIETPQAIAQCMDIAACAQRSGSRLDCLVVGTNDLAKDTGVRPAPDRRYLVSWLMQMILAARSFGLDALDGVYNDIRDDTGFQAECEQGRAMGFDGKTLVHPAQIDAANRIFGADPDELAAAQAIVAAFSESQNTGKGVITVEGRMVERLHLRQAQALLAKAAMPSHRKGTEK